MIFIETNIFKGKKHLVCEMQFENQEYFGVGVVGLSSDYYTKVHVSIPDTVLYFLYTLSRFSFTYNPHHHDK